MLTIEELEEKVRSLEAQIEKHKKMYAEKKEQLANIEGIAESAKRARDDYRQERNEARRMVENARHENYKLKVRVEALLYALVCMQLGTREACAQVKTPVPVPDEIFLAAGVDAPTWEKV